VLIKDDQDAGAIAIIVIIGLKDQNRGKLFLTDE